MALSSPDSAAYLFPWAHCYYHKVASNGTFALREFRRLQQLTVVLWVGYKL